jgi:hypothetical protein
MAKLLDAPPVATIRAFSPNVKAAHIRMSARTQRTLQNCFFKTEIKKEMTAACKCNFAQGKEINAGHE